MKDFAYHGLAALFFLSAGVDLAIITLEKKGGGDLKIYRTYISAVVSTITQYNRAVQNICSDLFLFNIFN